MALLPDWPEPLHPAATDGQPSAEDLDRADALRAAVASLPAGQRHAVALHYYADMPAGQAGGSPGAARASLHKARLRLRDYLTEHRPDLVSGRRTLMTAVRVARVERRIPPGPVPDRWPTHVIVLADDAGHRELPVWLLGPEGVRISASRRAARPCRYQRPPRSPSSGPPSAPGSCRQAAIRTGPRRRSCCAARNGACAG